MASPRTACRWRPVELGCVAPRSQSIFDGQAPQVQTRNQAVHEMDEEGEMNSRLPWQNVQGMAREGKWRSTPGMTRWHGEELRAEIEVVPSNASALRRWRITCPAPG